MPCLGFFGSNSQRNLNFPLASKHELSLILLHWLRKQSDFLRTSLGAVFCLTYPPPF